MTTGALNGNRPISMPTRKRGWLNGGGVTDFVEGLALATDEDDGLLILTDDSTTRDIIP